MRKRKLKIKNIIIFLLIIVVVISMPFLFNILKENIVSEYDINIKKILDKTKDENVSLNKVRIYGTHLNISGTLDNKKIYLDNINDAKLIFKDINNGKDIEIDIEYNVNSKGNLIFDTSDKINTGIYLDELKKGNYLILLKLKEKNYNTDSYDTNYYKVYNKDDTKRFDYYTITKNNKNNKIVINNYSKEINKEKYRYTGININDVELPDDIYDIVIDPGHGGTDSGEVLNGYSEKDITLDYGLLFKEKLESIGLKVKLTRDGTNEDELNMNDMYDDNGRVIIPNKVKAKYAFSIHLNSSQNNVSSGGVEVYVPNNADTTLASSLAKSIVEGANTAYSSYSNYKIDNGVYLRTFSYYEIADTKKQAEKQGFEPYDNLSIDTVYSYFIRETGGLNTKAYVDGRNTDYGKNKYYDSAIGVESYLVELGSIAYKTDIENIVNNKDAYVDSFVKAIQEYLQK